jgi:hypothetical protein
VSVPCEHCGKKHAGECWYKPGSKKRTRTEKKALKAAAELSRVESGEDTGSEMEETFDNYSRVSLLPPSSRIPRTCTMLHANLFIANPTRKAYPDTQAEVSITNTPEHVKRKHSKSAKLQGLLGKPQIAQYADLAFRLKTDKGRHITLRLRKPGLFLPEAKEILLAHQDLEDAGFHIDAAVLRLLSWHGIRQGAQDRYSRIQMPYESTHAGRRYPEKAPPTDKQLGHKGGTCACGALGRRGRFLCVLCRPAA